MSKAVAISVAVVAVVAQGMIFAPVTHATNSDKVTICHATNSQTNPYVKITVNSSSIDEANHATPNGHGTHEGGVWHKGIVAHTWGDIIPPFESPEGTRYAGMNWNDEGKTVYDKGCTVMAVLTDTPKSDTKDTDESTTNPGDHNCANQGTKETKNDTPVAGKGGVGQEASTVTTTAATTSVQTAVAPEATTASELPHTGPVQNATLLGGLLSGATYLIARRLQKKEQ